MRIIIGYLIACAITAVMLKEAEAATVSEPLDKVLHDIGYPYWLADQRRALTNDQACKLAGYDRVVYNKRGDAYCIKWSDK